MRTQHPDCSLHGMGGPIPGAAAGSWRWRGILHASPAAAAAAALWPLQVGHDVSLLQEILHACLVGGSWQSYSM